MIKRWKCLNLKAKLKVHSQEICSPCKWDKNLRIKAVCTWTKIVARICLINPILIKKLATRSICQMTTSNLHQIKGLPPTVTLLYAVAFKIPQFLEQDPITNNQRLKRRRLDMPSNTNSRHKVTKVNPTMAKRVRKMTTPTPECKEEAWICPKSMEMKVKKWMMKMRMNLTRASCNRVDNKTKVSR